MHKSKSNIIRKIIPPKVISEPDPLTGQYNPFPTFPYTGSVRPVYPLSERRKVPDRIAQPDYAKDGIPRSEQVFRGRNKITQLDAKEQEGMRKVCRLGREVLDIVAAEVKPGVTTDYLDEVCHNACLERDVSTKEAVVCDLYLTRLGIPLTPQLLPLPEIILFIGQRGHLPRHPRSAKAGRRRYCQSRHIAIPRCLPQ